MELLTVTLSAFVKCVAKSPTSVCQTFSDLHSFLSASVQFTLFGSYESCWPHSLGWVRSHHTPSNVQSVSIIINLSHILFGYMFSDLYVHLDTGHSNRCTSVSSVTCIRAFASWYSPCTLSFMHPHTCHQAFLSRVTACVSHMDNTTKFPGYCCQTAIVHISAYCAVLCKLKVILGAYCVGVQ